MADDATQQTTLVIPPELLETFGDLILLIQSSESMNDEERQYWINILPIMTPDQVQNLRGILENERKQLAAIDEKYRAQEAPQAAPISDDDRRKKREARRSQEATHKEQEEKKAEDILKSIEDER